MVAPNTEETFWLNVEPTGFCWLWTGRLDKDGYGIFNWKNKARKAHRMSWYFLVGEPDAELVADHLCRVRNCVNPDHLEFVTIQENNARGYSPSSYMTKNNECIYGHGKEFVIILGKSRRCKICETNSRRLKTLKKHRIPLAKTKSFNQRVIKYTLNLDIFTLTIVLPKYQSFEHKNKKYPGWYMLDKVAVVDYRYEQEFGDWWIPRRFCS